MKRIAHLLTAALLIGVTANPVFGQEDSQSYPVGNPLGVPATPSGDETFEPISSNVTVYGAIYSAESCTYDADANQLVIPMNPNNGLAFVGLE